ncbi:MAG: lipid-A-disaccharide synthase [Verrucomicrobiales bacterium]
MSESKEIFIVAGEHSGDLIGEMLVKELLALDSQLKITGLGGERMESAGAKILLNLVRDLAIIGVAEVILKFPSIYRAFYGTLDYLRKNRPAAVVFIDYPGFNLRLAKRVRKLGIPVVYYVTPQVWAWHRSRLGRMSRCIDMALVILPFEEKLLRDAGIPVRFVGTPWLDLMVLTMNRSEVFAHFGLDGEKKLIGILPGSRSREVATHLPLMLEAAERIQAERNDVQFVIVRASSVDADLIQRLVEDSNIQVKVVDTYRYNVRSAMDFAIVVSGTATLETGLLLCPMIILYKMNALTWYIGRKMIEIPDVGLINVVAGKRIVPELIGQHCTTANIAGETLRLLGNQEEMEEVRSQLLKVQEDMGGPGASKRAAGMIHSIVKQSLEIGKSRITS